MPITQQVNGLILYEPLDNSNDFASWTFVTGTTTYGAINSTADGFQNQTIPDGQQAAVYTEVTMLGGGGSPWEAWGGLTKTLNLGIGHGRRVHLYVGLAINEYQPATIYPFSTSAGFGNIIAGFSAPTSRSAWAIQSGTIPDSITGSQACYLGIILESTSDLSNVYGAECFYVHLVVCLNDDLTITGLTPGQKVSVYNAAGTLLVSGTVAPAQTELMLALPATELFPEQMYLQVTASDGLTLIDTTPLTTICGGDVWEWSSPAPELTALAANFIIYAKNAPGPTKLTTIDLTLLQGNGAPYVGAKLQLSVTIGTLSATSVVTNNQGFASVTFSSMQSGLAVITVTTAGFVNVAAATAYIPIHVFGGEEIPDPSQPFQVFIEGAPYVFTDGTYTRAADGVVGQFEVDIPAYLSSLVPLGIVSIYRFGVKDFTGILTRIERTLSDNPTVKLKGGEAAWLLNTRTVALQTYTGTAASILESLLADYPCGITPGQISLPPATINGFFVSVQLLAAINSVMKTITGEMITGTTTALTTGQFRVNPNLSLDASASLGKVTSAVFAEATVGDACLLVSGSNVSEDISLIANSIHAKGANINQLAQNPASILQYGLIESTDQEPGISDLPTLGAIAEFDAVKDAAAGLMVDILTLDGYPSGTYNLYDYVAVKSPTLGLSGLYQVKQITRSTLTNPYATELQLGARIPEVWQLDEPIKNTVGQLAGALVTPIGALSPTVLPLQFDAAAQSYGSASTYTASLTHAANVTVLIFVIGGASYGGGFTYYSPTSVTVGSQTATLVTNSTGNPTVLWVYVATVADAGTDTVTVNLNGSPGGGGGFTAISIKNSTTNVIDSNGAVGGAAVTSSPAPVTIGNGTVGRMIVVGTGTIDSTSTYPNPPIGLDAQLVAASIWPPGANGSITSLAVGIYLDNSGSGLTFNDTWPGGFYAASCAAAIKP